MMPGDRNPVSTGMKKATLQNMTLEQLKDYIQEMPENEILRVTLEFGEEDHEEDGKR